ncbi:MAG: HAD family phosphatase [Candidatus Campbellbacteria bacterium]|nr:HAD family phosphatase [Candidatus Campbellbacteria bacterium]
MIKVAIFDMDGLMFDTESAYSVVHGAMSKKRGKEYTLELKNSFMGKRASEVIEGLNIYWGKNENVKDLFKEQDAELVRIYSESVEKLKGLDSLLTFLNEHSIRKCIGTSSRRFLVGVLLKKFNLESEFEFIVSGDMVERGKPDPEIYLKCIAQLGVSPEECLVFEDSLNGVKAGVSAGCKVCAIPSEYTHHDDFSIASLLAESLDDKVIGNFILL